MNENQHENENRKAPDSFATTRARNAPVNQQGSRGSSYSGARAVVHDRAGLIALVVSGMALMGFFWAYSEMQEAKVDAQAAKNRADVAIMRTEGFTRALIAKGIDPYPHLQGEPP